METLESDRRMRQMIRFTPAHSKSTHPAVRHPPTISTQAPLLQAVPAGQCHGDKGFIA